MITPIAYTDSLRIGSVDFVSPDKIEVLLDIEAPASLFLLIVLSISAVFEIVFAAGFADTFGHRLPK
jgi:hypothetical protein